MNNEDDTLMIMMMNSNVDDVQWELCIGDDGIMMLMMLLMMIMNDEVDDDQWEWCIDDDAADVDEYQWELYIDDDDGMMMLLLLMMMNDDYYEYDSPKSRPMFPQVLNIVFLDLHI